MPPFSKCNEDGIHTPQLPMVSVVPTVSISCPESPVATSSSSSTTSSASSTISIERKTVRFYPIVKVHEIKSHKEYTREEAASTWYNQNDLQQMTKEVVKIVVRMKRRQQQSPNNDEESCCTRGLEDWLLNQHQLQQTRANHLRALHVVLHEQHIQQQHGWFIPERISDVYHEAALPSEQRALDVASQDALEVSSNFTINRPISGINNHVNSCWGCFQLVPSKWFFFLRSIDSSFTAVDSGMNQTIPFCGT